MAESKFIFSKQKFFAFLLILTLMAPAILISKTDDSKINIPERSIENFRIGLQSENYGLRMSCLYYAGKYKISEFGEDILELVKSSDDTELCQMAIWSLYQIGDEECCEKLQQIFKDHPSQSLRNCCEFLKSIKEYDKAVYEALSLSRR